MHVLVTGGCGYIGSILTQKLLQSGARVTAVDSMWFGNHLGQHTNLTVMNADIRRAENIPMEGLDAVVHLANIANDPCGDLSPKLSWEVNVLASMKLVEKAVQHKVPKFIYSSSGSVYGVKSEAQVTEELSLVPISDYNKTKMISERVLLSYQDRIQVYCIRPATVCGYSPRMRLDLSVNMLTMQALTRHKISVWGGSQIRPNIHIKDLADVFLHFLTNAGLPVGVYNAGFENLAIRQIAQKVNDFVPAHIEITESNDPRSYRLNSEKLMRTGFRPRYCVDDGIREIIAAYEGGHLVDDPNCYNVKTMRAMAELN